MNEPMVILERYRGPARSGNGGYVAGSLAARLPESADLVDETGEIAPIAVSLRQPPPLDVPMQVDATEVGVRLSFGGAVIADATFAEQAPEAVDPVSIEEATRASASYPGLTSHPFPTCFACGTERADGLRIFPGEVSASHRGNVRVAAPWTPDPSLLQNFHDYADAEQRVCQAATWSALDCVGGWAGDLGDRLMVLGRMTCLVDALPVVGEPHVVVGERLGSDGRKTFTAATLYDSDGRVVGTAEHLWVAVDPSLFN